MEQEEVKEVKKEKILPWEKYNEQKEKVFEGLLQNIEKLDFQTLSPQVIYPNGEQYEVKNVINNVILSTTQIDHKYSDNTWVLKETVDKARYEDKDGVEKSKFFLKKGEKATYIGVEVKERSVLNEITGKYEKEKLDKPYTKSIAVYNLSQFSFAKDLFPKKTYIENRKKDFITLDKEKEEVLNQNNLESKIEKFLIAQKYNIKNEINPINKEELVNSIKELKTFDGAEYKKESYKLDVCSIKAAENKNKTIENSIIEKNTPKEKNKNKEVEMER